MYKIDPKSGALINNDGEIINPKGRPLSREGREIPDPIPMSPPLGYKKQPSMMEQMRAMVRAEHARVLAEGYDPDSPEEAEDFDIGDDYDPSSPYELNFEPGEENPFAVAPLSSGSPDDESGGAAKLDPKDPSPSPDNEKT